MGGTPDASPRPLSGRLRLLVLVVTDDAGRTVDGVLRRLPPALVEHYEVEVLTIEQAAAGATAETTRSAPARALPFTVTVLRDPVDRGTGGRQKLGFRYAIDEGFDFVAPVADAAGCVPECLPDLAEPLRRGEADAVFGARQPAPGGRAPLGGRLLTALLNGAAGLRLGAPPTACRLYAVPALGAVPFTLNADDTHFDSEIVIQLARAGMRLAERPIPAAYDPGTGGVRRAVAVTALRAWLHRCGVAYDRRFDLDADDAEPDARGVSLLAAEAVPRLFAGQRVVAFGAAGGGLAEALSERGCTVTVIDTTPPARRLDAARVIIQPADAPLPDGVLDGADALLLPDTVGRLNDPEGFVARLAARSDLAPATEIMVGAANVAFVTTRLGLLAGCFGYGRGGARDRDHRRLFTLTSLARLFRQVGFEVVERKGLPATLPPALARGAAGAAFGAVSRFGARLWPGLFAGWIFLRVRKRPTLDDLLAGARRLDGVRTEPPPSPETPNPLRD